MMQSLIIIIFLQSFYNLSLEGIEYVWKNQTFSPQNPDPQIYPLPPTRPTDLFLMKTAFMDNDSSEDIYVAVFSSDRTEDKKR